MHYFYTSLYTKTLNNAFENLTKTSTTGAVYFQKLN